MAQRYKANCDISIGSKPLDSPVSEDPTVVVDATQAEKFIEAGTEFGSGDVDAAIVEQLYAEGAVDKLDDAGNPIPREPLLSFDTDAASAPSEQDATTSAPPPPPEPEPQPQPHRGRRTSEEG